MWLNVTQCQDIYLNAFNSHTVLFLPNISHKNVASADSTIDTQVFKSETALETAFAHICQKMPVLHENIAYGIWKHELQEDKHKLILFHISFGINMYTWLAPEVLESWYFDPEHIMTQFDSTQGPLGPHWVVMEGHAVALEFCPLKELQRPNRDMVKKLYSSVHTLYSRDPYVLTNDSKIMNNQIYTLRLHSSKSFKVIQD